MIRDKLVIEEFNFRDKLEAGLFICAGGFENRAKTFLKKSEKEFLTTDYSLILHYESQKNDNENNFEWIKKRIGVFSKKTPSIVSIHADKPIISCILLQEEILRLAAKVRNKKVIIDISGMTHLWALKTIHSCVSSGLDIKIIYTEAKTYFPVKSQKDQVVKAWRDRQYSSAAKYLQSAGLKAVQILPEFSGNFRPGVPTCLIVFVGYEPNRVEGLVDKYAPGALIVLYGKSPHSSLNWRTKLSKELHYELFSRWHVREEEICTFDIKLILNTLEREFKHLSSEYDIAITPQCSKMQAVASYLFWQRHPEVQLIFTTPVRFNPSCYSKGESQTFICAI